MCKSIDIFQAAITNNELLKYCWKHKLTAEENRVTTDGKEVFVEQSAGRIVLSAVLTEDESMLPTLAAYAAGRMLREEATLAFGKGNIFLWQDAPADADDRALLRLFESFADSCDWWRARVEERGKGDAVELSEAVIRP